MGYIKNSLPFDEQELDFPSGKAPYIEYPDEIKEDTVGDSDSEA